MSRFGFCSGSYLSQSPNVSADRCFNLIPENVESPGGKAAIALYGSPGLKKFSGLAGMLQVRGLYYFAGRLFAVGEAQSGQSLFEIYPDGTNVLRGTNPIGSTGFMGGGGIVPSFAANNANQLMISSGGRLFLLNLLTNAITQIDTTAGGPMLQGAVYQVGFSDGWFIAFLSNSQKFQISKLLDGSSWDPLNIAQVSEFPENVLSMLVDHREIWLWGVNRSIVYFDSGDPLFPFSPIPGALIEQGISAPDSPVRLDNSVFWLGGDERGSGVAWRAQGYTPARVSTHAVETIWQSYPTIADARGYPFQDKGHAFWHLYFPSADASWRLDVSTGLWAEVDSLDPQGTGKMRAHRSQCHAFAFGKHLVGDWQSGNIYEQDVKYLDDDGTPIRRRRRAPHISNEQEWVFHHQFQLDIETGLGPQPPLADGGNNPREPQATLRWSDDGGHVFTGGITVGLGYAGEYKKRAVWRRLGRSRDRVYEVELTDKIPVRIVDAYVKATPGYSASERLAKELAKRA